MSAPQISGNFQVYLDVEQPRDPDSRLIWYFFTDQNEERVQHFRFRPEKGEEIIFTLTNEARDMCRFSTQLPPTIFPLGQNSIFFKGVPYEEGSIYFHCAEYPTEPVKIFLFAQDKTGNSIYVSADPTADPQGR
jgi:hypothetical protein